MVLTLCTLSGHAFIFVPSFAKRSLKNFKSYKVDMISMLQFTKGHNSIKNVGRVMVLDL